LRQKIVYLENALREIEKERSEYKVKATMAEEQLNTLQEYYKKSTQDYQKKIKDLKKQLHP